MIQFIEIYVIIIKYTIEIVVLKERVVDINILKLYYFHDYI